MEREKYMEVQMLCNAFVNEVVTQITDIREGYLQMERPPYEKGLVDIVLKAAETMRKTGDFFPPDTISHFIHAAETVLTLMLRERLALHEPTIILLLDAATLIKKTMGRLPSGAIP
jgi:chemotaxis protein histidine kinase CheA